MNLSEALRNHSIVFYLIGWAVLSAAIPVSIIYQWPAVAVVLIGCWIALFGKLYGFYAKSARKVAFMFNSLDNADYSFKFTTDNLSKEDRMLNMSLNRISHILLQARNEAMEREKFYELIINSVKTGIVVADDSGNVYQSNDAALKLLGISVLTHTSQLGRVSETLRKNMQNVLPGERRQLSFQNERDTVNLSLQASSALLKGRPMRIIAINDINSVLEDNEIDSWIKLIRVLTHEIMNSVTPVTSLSETLLTKIGDNPSEIRDGLEVIHRTSSELVTFVESYRKFTHVPTPVPTLFYVKEFVEHLQKIFLRQLQTSAIALQIEVEPADLIVYADESLISHVLTNLLKNAIQAIESTGHGGHIRIRSYSNEAEEVIIDITDDGPPIPQDVAQHIFVPFFTTKTNGSGIGLSISKQIMRLSGGTLTLLPAADDGQTTFELRFL